MATSYSGFASRKLEDLYTTLVSKTMSMLSLKVLYTHGGADSLTDELREEVRDEKVWSQKILKLYRSIRKMESRKYHGKQFAEDFRHLTSFFSLKHQLWRPNTDGRFENMSVFSAGSKASSFNASSPKPFIRRP